MVDHFRGFGPEWLLRAIPRRLNKVREPAVYTSIQHAQAYLAHLSDQIPYALTFLANPAVWRMPALLDAESQTLRKPRIRIDASITQRDTLQLSWYPVPNKKHPEGACTTHELLKATDYLELRRTWGTTDAAGDVLVRLLRTEYPASPEYGPKEATDLLQEEEDQRRAFKGFLASVLAHLKVSLDVQIGDWVEFDENNRVVQVSLETRTHRLAAAQLEAATKAADKAKASFCASLEHLGIGEQELEQAIAKKLADKATLSKVLTSMLGRKVHPKSANACEAYLEKVQAAEESVAACEDILKRAAARW